MFIGHYGVALAAKRVAPRVSLGVLVAAAQLADLVWPILLILGVERIRITPSDNPFLGITFESYPWTHSLLAAIVWGALAGLGYAALRGRRADGVVVGLVVVSHWVLDWITHVPDLPLYPGGASRRARALAVPLGHHGRRGARVPARSRSLLALYPPGGPDGKVGVVGVRHRCSSS